MHIITFTGSQKWCRERPVNLQNLVHVTGTPTRRFLYKLNQNKVQGGPVGAVHWEEGYWFLLVGRKVPRFCLATPRAVWKMKLAVLARTTPIRKGPVLQKYFSLPICCRRAAPLWKGSLVSLIRRHIWTWQSGAPWKTAQGGRVLGIVFLREIGQPEKHREKLVMRGQCSCSVLLISSIPLLGFRKTNLWIVAFLFIDGRWSEFSQGPEGW